MSKNSLTNLLADVAVDDDFADYLDNGRRQRPARAWRAHKAPKPKRAEIVESVAERADGARSLGGFTLGPGLDVTKEEREWVWEHLSQFYSSKIITSALRRVKGGKEANVYCCAAHPETGLELVAAKVYRPRLMRSMRNYSQYKQGRPLLNANGEVIDPRDWRMRKAVEQKSNKGQAVEQTSWVEYEFQTMQRLHAAGVLVPRPLRHGANTILMEYLGEAGLPAPTLNLVTLERDEAVELHRQLIESVERMLAEGIIHGDLSAYNVLYWEGVVKIIDFPQVVQPGQNPEAYAIFRRDVERLCQYFARHGAPSQPARLAREMWQRHVLARDPVH